MNDILKRLGIDALNEMQVSVCEAITQSDDDIVVLSPTGTGKTLAYLLPLQQQPQNVCNNPWKGTYPAVV